MLYGMLYLFGKLMANTMQWQQWSCRKIIFFPSFWYWKPPKMAKKCKFQQKSTHFSTKSTLNMSCYTFMKCLIQKQSNIGNYTIKNKFFFSFWYWNLQKWLKIVNFNKNQHIFPTKSTQSMTCWTFLKYLRLKQCNNGNYTEKNGVFFLFGTESNLFVNESFGLWLLFGTIGGSW